MRAEAQAIAIYEAEIYWRGPGEENVFAEILAEEQNHAHSLSAFSEDRAGRIEQISGWILGSLFCLLPRRLCFLLHAWAEQEAQKIYLLTHAKLLKDEKSLNSKRLAELLELLKEAAAQEKQHSERFRKLAKKALPHRVISE